jgi:hypothetical protein
MTARGSPAAGCHNRLVLVRQILLVLGVFVGATLLALLLGAKNLGTALTFGQIAFAFTVVVVILRSPSPRSREPED